MAEATFLHIHEPNDDIYLPELDHMLFRYSNDFDLYASDSEFPPSDHLLHFHSVTHEDDLSDHFDCASIAVRGLEDFSDHDSISNADIFDRENQVNFVMDLFQRRVEQSQVLGDNDFDSEELNDSNFGVIEGNSDVGIDEFGVDLGFGIGIDVEPVDWDDNCLFIGGHNGRDQNLDDDDDYISSQRMASVSINGERPSLIRLVQPYENGAGNAGFESDSDEEESDVLGICINSEDECDVHEANDGVVSISLFRDSLQLDDDRDSNEDFEWEEVDDRVDDSDVLTLLTAENERTVSVSVSTTGGTQEEDVSTVRVGGMESLEWQVLSSPNNFGNTMDVDHAAESYLGEQYDYFNTTEYDTMFGQFADNENPLTGRPPAAKSIVQNLPSVVFSKEDIENDKPLCAICKEDFNVGEHAKKLACGHRYHGDCIIPWLGIRNTCPVCRYECPTDSAAYEYRVTRGSGGLRSEHFTQILFEP